MLRFVFLLIGSCLAGVTELHAQIREEHFLLDGRNVYLAMGAEVEKEARVLMAIHGSGREAGSYIPGDEKASPFYIHQRDLALACGYLFVVVSNGPDTWGTDNGLQVLDSLYNYVNKQYNTTPKWVLWATSAGGVLMNRMVKTYPERVEKAIGTFPVYDLEESYEHLTSAQKAWKSLNDCKTINPARDPEALVNVPYLLFHGQNDLAVPAKAHSERHKNEVNKLGGNVELHLVSGGHSTDNWNLYQDERIKTYLLNR